MDDPEDKWAAELPGQLERLLGGSGIVQGMATPGPSTSRRRSLSPTSSLTSPRGKGKGPANTNLSFARRRRWASNLVHSRCLGGLGINIFNGRYV